MMISVTNHFGFDRDGVIDASLANNIMRYD